MSAFQSSHFPMSSLQPQSKPQQNDDANSVSSLGSNGTTLTEMTSASQYRSEIPATPLYGGQLPPDTQAQHHKTQTLHKNKPIHRPPPRPSSRASRVSHSSRLSKRSKLTDTNTATTATKLETKEDLENHVRKWIRLDNELRQLQALARERREMKKQITQDLVDVMRENEIDFNLSDGKLVYKQSKRTAPINDKHITACLMEILHYNPDQAKEVTDAIMSRRDTKMVDTVQRRIDKGAKDNILNAGKEALKQMLMEE